MAVPAMPAAVHRQSAEARRLRLYAQLLLLDLAALLIGPIVATVMLGDRHPATGPFSAILALYLLQALERGCFSSSALHHAALSVRNAVRALASALTLILVAEVLLRGSLEMVRPDVVLGTGLSCLLLIVSRALFPRYVARHKRGHLVNRLIIVDGKPGSQWPSTEVVVDAGMLGIVPDLASPAMLQRFGQLAKGMDCVLVDCSPDRQRAWALMLKGANVEGEILTDEYSVLGAVGIRNFHGRESLLVSRKPLLLGERMRKRAFDLALTIPIILAISPVLILTALAIKLDSPGPVLFKQDRIGRGNRLFKVLKFRSMRVEGSDATGSKSTERNDSRITRVGRIIRSTSIDELPQLLNVLLGDMSLVGPRPHPLGSLAEGKLFWDIDETYWLRHQLKPGITGLAQVRGFRGATHELADLTNRLQADLEYIQGWSIWRDVVILVNTARVVAHPNAF